jgi:hypothetical protein
MLGDTFSVFDFLISLGMMIGAGIASGLDALGPFLSAVIAPWLP